MNSGEQFAAMKSGKQFAGGWLVVLVVAVFGFVVLQLTQGSVLQAGGSKSIAQGVGTSSQNATLHDDAKWLIARCGRPDRDLDTGGFDPAPLVPARVLTYGKAHLKIAYVAGDPRGQDPPYHWKLMGLVDTRTNHAIDLSAFRSTLEERLHCMLNR